MDTERNAYNHVLGLELAVFGNLVNSQYMGRLYEFSQVLASHDLSTAAHDLRVARRRAVLEFSLGGGLYEIACAFAQGLLHDGGKISVPVEILNKKGKLTRNEMQIIRSHVTRESIIVRDVLNLAAQPEHHEFWGPIATAMLGHHLLPYGRTKGITGYGSWGLQVPGKYNQIPVAAVYVHFCDVLDASVTREDRVKGKSPFVSQEEEQDMSDSSKFEVRNTRIRNAVLTLEGEKHHQQLITQLGERAIEMNYIDILGNVSVLEVLESAIDTRSAKLWPRVIALE